MNASDILTSSGKYPERTKKYPPNIGMIANAADLAARLSRLLVSFSSTHNELEERKVRSGYRPKEINENTPGSAPNSNHLRCEAADIDDVDGALANWCMANLDLLAHFGLWMEDPRWTRTIKSGESEEIPEGQSGWVHLQMVPPKSGNRVFIPYAGDPP